MLTSVHTTDGRRGGTTCKSINYNNLELTTPVQQLHDPNQYKNLPVYYKGKCIFTNQRRWVYATTCVLVVPGRRSWETIVLSRKDKIEGTFPGLGLGVVPRKQSFFHKQNETKKQEIAQLQQSNQYIFCTHKMQVSWNDVIL